MVEIIRVSPVYESPTELQPKVTTLGKRDSTNIRAVPMAQPTGTRRLSRWDDVDLDANEARGRELSLLGSMENGNTNQHARSTPRIIEVLRNPGIGAGGQQVHALDTESLDHVFTRRKVNGVWNPSQNSDLSVHLEMEVKLDLEGALEEFCRLYRVGNFVGAETFFAENLEDHLDRPDVLISYAEMLLQQGDYLGIRELDDSAIRSLAGKPVESMEARLLRAYWELIVIFAKSHEPGPLEVQARRTFRAAKDLYDVVRCPDRDISSTEIRLLSLLVHIDRRPHKSLYGLASHAIEQFFAPELLIPIYKGLLRQGRIWDMHDLTETILEQGYIPEFLHDLFGQSDIQLGLQQLVSDWEQPDSDEASTTLALLDTLMFLIFDGLSPSYIVHGKGILDMATSLARSISQKHPSSMKSRAYTRWLLARSYCYGSEPYTQISRSFIQHLVDSEGVFWMPPRRALPQYIPLHGESPGWEQPDAAPEVFQAVQLVLNTTRELGDYKTEVLALKRLIQLSKSPAAYFGDLCEVQKTDQGDMDGHLETLLSKYLAVSPGDSQTQLKVDLGEQIFAPGFDDSFSTDKTWLAYMLFSSLEGKGPRAEEADRIADKYYELLDEGLCDLLNEKMPELRDRVYNRRALVRYTNRSEVFDHPAGNENFDLRTSPLEMPNTEPHDSKSNWVYGRIIEEDSEAGVPIRTYSPASSSDEVDASPSPEFVEATEAMLPFHGQDDPVQSRQVSHDDYSSYPLFERRVSNYTPTFLHHQAFDSKTPHSLGQSLTGEPAPDLQRSEPPPKLSNSAVYESHAIQADSMDENEDLIRLGLWEQDDLRASPPPANEGDWVKNNETSNEISSHHTEKVPAELDSTQLGLGLPESLKPRKNDQGEGLGNETDNDKGPVGVDRASKDFQQRDSSELEVVGETTEPVVEKAPRMNSAASFNWDSAPGEIPNMEALTIGGTGIQEFGEQNGNMETAPASTIEVPSAEVVRREQARIKGGPPMRASRRATNLFEPREVQSQEPSVGIKKIVSFGDKPNTNNARSREYEDLDNFSSNFSRSRSWQIGQLGRPSASIAPHRHGSRPRSSHADFAGLASPPIAHPVIINNKIHSRHNSAKSPVRKPAGRSNLLSGIKRSSSARKSNSQRRPPDEAPRTVASTPGVIPNRARSMSDTIPSRSGSRSKGRGIGSRDRAKDAGLSSNTTTHEEVVVSEMLPAIKRSASIVDKKGKQKDTAAIAYDAENADVSEHPGDDDKHSRKASRSRREPEGDGWWAEDESIEPISRRLISVLRQERDTLKGELHRASQANKNIAGMYTRLFGENQYLRGENDSLRRSVPLDY